MVKLSNNGVFRRDDVDIKDSENSGSSVKTAYLLGIAASFLVCLFGKKISAVEGDEMTKEQSFSSRARGLKGQFSSGRNQTAAVNAKLRKMNMARQKCKRELDTETEISGRFRQFRFSLNFDFWKLNFARISGFYFLLFLIGTYFLPFFAFSISLI